MNNNWYAIVNVRSNKVIEYRMFDNEWLDMTDMWSLTDIQLQTIYQWNAKWPYSVVKYDTAVAMGVNLASLNMAVQESQFNMLNHVRSMRDPLLIATDIATLSDKWNKFDSVSQNKITTYRQQLRDLTNTNLVNVVWPTIPVELDFIRSIDLSQIPRPTNAFLLNLKTPTVYTIAAQQADTWERIKNERDRRKSGGVPLLVNGKQYWFWNDEASRNQYALMDNIIRRYNLANDSVIQEWKTMSGEFVPMTVKLLYQVIDTGVALEKTLFTVTEQLYAKMLASPNPSTFDYRSGWPQTYDEYVAANSSTQ